MESALRVAPLDLASEGVSVEPLIAAFLGGGGDALLREDVPLEEDVLPDPEELPLLLEDPEEGDPALPLSFLAVPFAMATYAYHREKGPCCTARIFRSVLTELSRQQTILDYYWIAQKSAKDHE